MTSKFYNILSAAMIADVEVDATDDCENAEPTRTDLDSHANMPVVGRNAYVISDTGRVVDVSPFTPDYKPLQLPIVDAAIQYDCPYNGVSHILVIRNALHVPSMRNNLIPPFIMREAGIQLRDTPKIQVSNPSEDDHSLYFPGDGFRIPLSLWGVFSYFPSSKPTASMLEHSDEIHLITPE